VHCITPPKIRTGSSYVLFELDRDSICGKTVNIFYQPEGSVLNVEGVLQKAGDFLLRSFRCLLENSRSYVDYPVHGTSRNIEPRRRV
jgi:hypothetical protein